MHTSAWFHRIKAAQRDLIRLVGGIERASEISSVSPSHIGRMNNPRDTDLMPISVVYALESECGLPLVTSAMAELSGRRLTDPEGDRAVEQSAILAYADMMQQAGDLFSGAAIAFSDLVATPAEATKMDRDAAALEAKIGVFRKALAGVKARGGEKFGLRVVGDQP
ncbi:MULTISPECIES: hypothetical protein [Rhizobium/Agrobacterium group]|uniref:Uncharacterized protein n=2 Tax=Rhizobium/Agrobacterium group TaxID=227290 RepID=B9JVX0_ALLAM|nr:MULTISPECIES: hypothetical protein [Rhizobium/Agrobacterium group]ACM36400.1 hypothetical protein Avi_1955 [Allorhizobium ampelinum S4]MUO27714.1 hypothetical protein [Agrobacterium vitis]MUO44227.1 hypothetical protein [Agrobacterium vitis]MUP12325.1 hypothetical protein [Agrobacterium vitis]MVA73613.1 hypothetical protein [Agrobacterium vitis]